MAANYTALVAEIKDWSHRGNIDARIPGFIEKAEDMFNRTLRVRQMEKRYVYDALVGERYIAVPGDYLGVRNVQINADRERALEYLAPDVIDQRYASTTLGVPQAFTVIGEQFQFAPSPASEYQFEIAYYQKVPPLSLATPTNWLLSLHGDLYLYASLIHAAAFTGNDDRAVKWRTLVAEQLNQIKAEDMKARYPATPLRARLTTPTP